MPIIKHHGREITIPQISDDRKADLNDWLLVCQRLNGAVSYEAWCAFPIEEREYILDVLEPSPWGRSRRG